MRSMPLPSCRAPRTASSTLASSSSPWADGPAVLMSRVGSEAAGGTDGVAEELGGRDMAEFRTGRLLRQADYRSRRPAPQLRIRIIPPSDGLWDKFPTCPPL